MKTSSPGAVSILRGGGWVLAAGACFHLAYEIAWLRGLMVGFLFCLVPLARLNSGRQSFYLGLLLGLGMYAPQLAFFWTIFQGAAVALWLVLAFWIGLFVALGRLGLLRLGRRGLMFLPVLWLGIEYFRSELYYLRFSWLAAGGALSGSRLAQELGGLGVYGIGALFFCGAVACWWIPRRGRWIGLSLAVVVTSLAGLAPPKASPADGTRVEVAGVQLEFPDEQEVVAALDRLAELQPRAAVYLLSEYTFQGPVPPRILRWCRQHEKFLVVGAEELVGDDFFNTAFVIGPDGCVAFQQAKSVPIQFFKDGLPARTQRLWASPWGSVGVAVCYDLSYRRVIDRLVRQGAQALIIPTMDVAEWGDRQHRLHARIAPVRAAEYGIPIVRLCSSGVSQVVDRSGRVDATAPPPGQGAVLAGAVVLGTAGRLPLDSWLGPGAVGASAILALWLVAAGRSHRGSG